MRSHLLHAWLGCIPLSLAASLPVSGQSPNNGTQGLLTCLNASQVPFLVPSSTNWTSHTTTYNARLQYTPAAVLLPTTPQHISSGVICAAQNGIPVQAKSGGHSYGSFSMGGRDGILVVDLENLNDITVDRSTGIAVVGAGVRIGNLALAVYEQGRRALAHGTCPGVGVGGHFTHGGFGYASRAFGLAMDQIIGLDVVLANGSFIRADQREHSDVFWALRGAADSLAIITTFHLQTAPAPPRVVQFRFSFPRALSSVSSAVAAFRGVQDFASLSPSVDRNLGLGVTIADNAAAFVVHGTYLGGIAAFNRTVAPALLASVPFAADRYDSSVEEVGWIASLTHLSGYDTLSVPLRGYDGRDNFFAKSVTTVKPFSEAALKRFFGFVLGSGVGNAPPVGWFSIFDLHGGPGSAIGRRDGGFAAYGGYGDLWVVQNYGFVGVERPFPNAGMRFMNSLNDALALETPGYGAYPNYVDPSYSRDEALRRYYGDATLARLNALKEVLDPGNVFSNPQSI
ncbi:Glucooligosaccharide oxidase [Podospora aff. communis PSN243]|uniref:Glucooligosaccharide oxidase n=1 Tax=Podospora aff. communis PSN243 TaxID=3040156 RepID=A0AAV9G4N5_9PEZI|nr:Glucooligosaccharide oxidase [Podospora aff. communis PSN243]